MRARALLVLLLTIALTISAPAVRGAPATAFRVTLPETVIVEELFDFTVEAVDGNGTVDPTYTGTVGFGSLNGEAELPPNYTFTAGDAGVHVFSAKMLLLGDNKDIMVVDLSNASITGSDTTEVRLAPGPTEQLVIAAPATANLGQPFNFTVTAAHADGTPTGDYTGTVAFDNTGLSNPLSYTFTPADGGTKTFTATPFSGGEVRIRVWDVEYPLVSGETGLEIDCPGFTVTASNSGPSCFEEAPTLTASTSEIGVTFHWFGPAGWSADGQVVTGVPRFQGSYHVRMTHPNGCTTIATTEARLSDASPEVEPVENPSHACDTVEKTFAITDTATNGPYTNIVWDVTGPGTIVSGQGTPAVTIAGDYDENGYPYPLIYLRLSATNVHGCETGHRTAAIIELYPRPVATIDTPPAAACPGVVNTARPILAPSPIPNISTTYAWSIENGTITEFNQPAGDIKYTVSGQGDTVLTLTATNPYCSYTTTTTVTSGPAATIAPASHEVCANETVEIPVTLIGTPPFTIAWSDGPRQTGVTGSFTRTVSPSETTHYSIISISDANCTIENVTGTVEVTTRDEAAITRQPAVTTVLRGNRATLSVEVTPDPTSVQWYRGARGDRTNPVSGGTSLQLITPPITQETSFWAEIGTNCGSVMSNAATVKFSSRRRAVGHP